MELRVLNYFLTVAREKTISQAAAVLHLTQPTLSKQLKELEAELGVQLFIRGNRGIVLTEAGNYLQNRGQEILSLVNITLTNLKKQEAISGTIAIGSGETQAFQFLTDIMNELMLEYPDINIRMDSGNANDVLQKIDQGLLDFDLVIDPVAKQKYEYVRLPMLDRWGLLINRQHELADKQVITPEELKAVPLLISNQTAVDNQLADWFGRNLANYNVVGTYNLLYNAALLVKAGNCAALCIDGIINTRTSEVTFIPLAPSLTASISIIWKKEHVFSNAAALFLQTLRQKLAASK